jgi:glycosyltransferase involved in cell wall biosynthesis
MMRYISQFDGNPVYSLLPANLTSCIVQTQKKDSRMTANVPLVSIGMPVYNEERYLEQALQSLLSQSYTNFEVIISDNASTDRTRDICLAYAANDPRVRYSPMNTNVGSILNFNRAFHLSSAPYFCWASGHDTRHETFIARCVEILERDASVVLSYTRARWLEIDGHLSDVLPGNVETRAMNQLARYRKVLWGLGYVYPVYGIMRSDALKRTGLMRPNTVAGDVVLMAELALLGTIAEVPEPLLHLQRLSDYGSWRHYMVKALGPASERRSTLYLYSKMICEHLRIIFKHATALRDKPLLVSSVILCILTKYRWILRDLKQRWRQPESKGV